MLPKINRIRKKRDFEIIFKKGEGIKNSLLILKVYKNNFDQNRFGFVVSQKVSKKATERNKIRRRMSEIIKSELKDMKSGLDLVFVSLPSLNKKDFLETKKAVDDLLTKAKIIIKTK
jgi:ribonuclease P protein component